MHAVLFALALNTFDLQGYVAGRGVQTAGEEKFLGVAQLGVEWTPSRHFDVHVSGATYDHDNGLVEAFADARLFFGLDQLQFRAGQFFLPSSRENKDELWTSPYTINFSALNTWIAEEVRPVGVDVEWRHTLGNGHVLTTAATAFRGNDAMGALLGWRGWTIGNRLTTYDEVLPLPPLDSLQTFFADQRDDGTKPFGEDLDGNTGIAARIRYSVPQTANIQYVYLDNRADRRLHQGEYAWATDFHLISAEAGNPDKMSIAAEYMTGSTGMGFTPAFVQSDFYATYILLSEKVGRTRWTARYDLFGTQEKDFSLAEPNDESGRSWTLSLMIDVGTSLRLGTELTQIAGHRGPLSLDTHSYTVEARWKF